MATKPKVKPKARPKGPWTPEEIARNERANKAQVKRDRARGVSTNLEEVVALNPDPPVGWLGGVEWVWRLRRRRARCDREA